MKSFVAVLRREIAEHRLLLAGAFLVSLFPVLLPLLPGIAGQSPDDVADARGGAALILAGVLSAILAATLGATVLARDLSERRLGFYFSRPISGLAIWAGKTLAALVVTLTGVAVVLFPVFLLGDFTNADRFLGFPPLALALLWSGLVLLLLLVAHTVSSMVRSRTAWLLLDLTAAVVIAGLLLASYRRLIGEGAYMVAQLLVLAFLVLFLLALLIANLMQILRGRTELHRGHRWLSSVLWSLLLTGAVALAGYTEWVLRAQPEDLSTLFQARCSPDGEWLYLAGLAAGRPGYEPTFLMEASSGRFVRLHLPPAFWHFDRLEFSRDGRWAAWLEGGETVSLVRLDLKAPELRPVRQVLREAPGEIALSPDGSHLAVRLPNRLVVEETATARLIASVPVQSSEAYLHFRDPNHLLLVRSVPQEDSTVIDELDLASGKLSRVSSISGWVWQSAISPDGRRLFMNNREGRGFQVHDVATGAELARLEPPPNVASTGRATFLRDGRIVASRWSYGGTELRVFDRDGSRVLQTFRWPDYRDLQVGGELSGDRLIVILSKERYRRHPMALKTVVLDLATGQSRPLGVAGLVPLWDYSEEPSLMDLKLFFRPARRELFRLDPETGEVQKVLTLS